MQVAQVNVQSFLLMLAFNMAFLLNLQKLIFLDTAEGVSSTIRPYWSEAARERANVVQAVPDMLEIVPPGTSKGSGVRLLLDHLSVSAKEVWVDTIAGRSPCFIVVFLLFI